MSWIAVAVGAAATIYASNQASSAASDAAQTQANATTSASDAQYKLGMKALELQQPFYEAAYPLLSGLTAEGLQTQQQLWPLLYKEATATGPSMASKMQMSEIQNAINNAASAKGLVNSGAAVQAISSADQNILANQTANQQALQTQMYGLGQGLVNSGQSSAAQAASGLNQTGSGVANTTLTGGLAQAQSQLSAGQSTANMYQGLGGLVSGAITGYNQNQSLQDYLNSGYNNYYTNSNYDAYGNATGTGWE